MASAAASEGVLEAVSEVVPVAAAAKVAMEDQVQEVAALVD